MAQTGEARLSQDRVSLASFAIEQVVCKKAFALESHSASIFLVGRYRIEETVPNS
jgi:hypothetical protein